MIEPELYERVEKIAQERGTTRSEIVNEALRKYTQRELLESDEGHVAGVVAQAVERAVEKGAAGWRALLARNGMEILRLQYVLFHLLLEANVQASQVEKWRKEGWNYAIKEYKRKPQYTLDEEDE